MQTATLTWTDPTGALTGVEIAIQIAGAPSFTPLSTVAPGAQKATIPDLVDGNYNFRVTPLNGTARAAGSVVSGTVVTPVAPPATPGEVTGLAVSFA